MAVKNRVESIAEVDSKIVPTVTNAILRDNLNNDILNSVKFDKDVIGTETPVAGAVTVDFSTKDIALITTAVDLAITISNLENGAEKHIEITKLATNAISFVGVTDLITYKGYINQLDTKVLYKLTNKNGTVYAESIYSPPFINRMDQWKTQATAAGTTTLTSASEFQQVFTGTTTQIVKLPVVSTLSLGFSFRITNKSTGKLTIRSSGNNLITYIEAGRTKDFICIAITGTSETSWQATYGHPNTETDPLYFDAIRTSDITNIAVNTPLDIVFDSSVSPYVNGSGVFTAPSAGLYLLGVYISLRQIDITATKILLSGFGYTYIDPRMFAVSPDYYTMRLEKSVYMDAGDTFIPKIEITGGASQTDIDYLHSRFYGCKIG